MVTSSSIYEQLYKDLSSGEIDRVIHIINEETLKENFSIQEFSKNFAEVIREVFNDFYIAPVHIFIEEIKGRISKELMQGIASAVNPFFELSKKFSQKIDEVYQERLSREIRDFIRVKNIEGASDCAVKIITRSKTSDDVKRFCSFIGALTGSLIHDQKNVDSMIALVGKKLVKLGYSHDCVNLIDEAKKQRFETILKSRMETSERDWTRILVETAVEIKSKLPDRFQMREPNEQEMSVFRDIACAIFRVPFYKGNEDKWIDVINVLVDFCPKELGGLASMAGAEPRIYNTLGLTAKRIVNRNFERIGKAQIIQNAFLKMTQTFADTQYFEKLIELIGALRSSAFYPFLKNLLGQKKYRAIRGILIDAIGQVSGTDSRKQLLEILAEDCQGLIDPPKIREANRIIIALGKIIKHPQITAEDRKYIAKKVSEIIPKSEKKISTTAALQIFSYKPEELDEPQIKWAAEVLTESLWLMDEKTEYAKGEERPASILGFREAMTNALINIGSVGLPEIIKIAEQNSNRYCGAFLAIGEIFTKIGNESAIPVIEKMLFTSFIFDENAVDKYHKETFWDPADKQNKPLSKDKIISTLVYAVKTIGGKSADELLQRLYNQIQSGRLQNPGPETARFLVDVSLKAKMLSQKSEGESGDSQKKSADIYNDLEMIEKSIDALKANYFLKSKNTKRVEKIRALQILGELKPVEPIPIIIRQLDEKDPLIRSAALSCLTAYGDVNTQTDTFKKFIYKILEMMPDFQVETKAEVMKILIKSNPARKDYFDVLNDIIASKKATKCKLEIENLLQVAKESLKKEKVASEVNQNAADGKNGEGKMSDDKPEKTTTISELEKKRIYLEARRAWIAGGKKGQPPEPPK